MHKDRYITVTFLLLWLMACNNAEEPDNSVAAPLAGRWSGNIYGGDPHFEENATVTLLLDQNYEQISGTITTSDGAFQADSLLNGRFVDNQLTFDAVQSEIYPGADLSFTAQRQDSTLTGTWQHGKLHNGIWNATKVIPETRSIKNE